MKEINDAINYGNPAQRLSVTTLGRLTVNLRRPLTLHNGYKPYKMLSCILKLKRSDLSVTHNILHIDEKRYSFCFHFIVYLKHNF